MTSFGNKKKDYKKFFKKFETIENGSPKGNSNNY